MTSLKSSEPVDVPQRVSGVFVGKSVVGKGAVGKGVD
jgi:hypothetical protein